MGGIVFALFYCVGYFVVAHLSCLFFGAARPRFGAAAVRSMATMAVLIIGVFLLADMVPDAALGNRLQHGIGGGVLGVLLCFLIFFDQRIPVTRFQFFVWSAFVVTGLGVANELLEFFVQSYTNMVFAADQFDTWRDFASNSVGIVVASPVATYFLRKI